MLHAQSFSESANIWSKFSERSRVACCNAAVNEVCLDNGSGTASVLPGSQTVRGLWAMDVYVFTLLLQLVLCANQLRGLTPSIEPEKNKDLPQEW